MRLTFAIATFLCLAGCNAAAPLKPASNPAFTGFIDAWLDSFALRHPAIAAGNGLHSHDDKLEDFSAAAIADEVRWHDEQKAALNAFDPATLTPDEFVDRQILSGIIDGWLLDLRTARSHQRNPMVYASALSSGIHNLMVMTSDPADVRMRRISAKLERLPDLLKAETENLDNPPELLVLRGIGMFRGIAGMLRDDLPVAFAGDGAPELRSTLFAAAKSAAQKIDGHASWLEKSVLPKARGVIALGADYVAARYRAEELIDTSLDQMLAIGQHELVVEQKAFVEAAGKVSPGRDPMAVWADILHDHPQRGEVAAAAQKTVDELQAFVTTHNLAGIPTGEKVIARAAPAFEIGLASMHASPPLEPTPVPSYLYITDANPAWPEARQQAWLQRFNRPSLAITVAHEAIPGHFLQSLFMRRTPGKIRRIWIGLNPFPQPSSGQDGWAHYAEHLVVEQGFHAEDPRYAMAQLSESMTRICRLIASINVHTGRWTIDQATGFFEHAAHVPAPAARQEAERTSYDPTNGGYFLGKRAALKLRRDYETLRGSKFTLREFHERVMTNGIAPWWAHRYLLLPGDNSPLVE